MTSALTDHSEKDSSEIEHALKWELRRQSKVQWKGNLGTWFALFRQRPS